MNNPPVIRLLASASNERGDLFTRLTKDLFFALGYDNLRLDVHKSGRELDIQGEHRLEPRHVVAECKAHAAKMGGDELNKFFGALTRERKKHGTSPVAGYFVSLSGFKETGIEQEIETGDDRIILLNSQKIIEELERCRVIVGRTEAAECAGRCVQYVRLQGAMLDGEELLGHQRGYIWAVSYAQGKERSHCALIHADGTPLAENVAREIVEADRICGGSLYRLQYLAPPTPAPDRIALAAKADESYRKWIGEECGYIQLDGLPADADLSATRLKLERLFVPLKVNFLSEPDAHPDLELTLREMVYPVGEVLEKCLHLALLAMPGGGKSTLLKRLATAYAFPQRRSEIDDSLPQRDWLPLILRCRELRDRAHRPIIELLDDIPRHAGMRNDESVIFRDSIHTALRAGNALLLIDGLDEISDEGDRQTFANHLRTFIAMFPQAALIVTSREAGFRLVAGVVASTCVQAKIAPLDEDEVLSLCERWHVEVIGDSEKIRSKARNLGQEIWNNQSIRKLTENPLLLTTLLVVNRGGGELPPSRVALYREAIKVLVRTWNVEGYKPLDEDETLAQLSYVACFMMEEGSQQIGQKALLKLLQNSRRELEAELQFARISPQEFMERIEYRSSLLMQTGHENIDNVLQPVYEFRHLTFQEYLAARGYVEEQYPGRNSGESLTKILGQHFEDERWREIIPLGAVLAGRKAEDLIKRLTAESEILSSNEVRLKKSKEDSFGVLLYRCILDEIQVTAPTLRRALLELARSRYRKSRNLGERWVITILKGKFGAVFKEVIEQTYLNGSPGFEQYNSALTEIAMYSHFGEEKPILSPTIVASLTNALKADDRLGKIYASLVCMVLAYDEGYKKEPRTIDTALQEHFHPLIPALNEILNDDDWPSALAASWAMAWVGSRRLQSSPPEPKTILSLYKLWHKQELKEQSRYFAWALSTQPLLPRETFNIEVWGDCDLFLRQALLANEQKTRLSEFARAAVVVGWYRRSPWSDSELVDLISKQPDSLMGHSSSESTLCELLGNLGDSGRVVLKEWERKRAEREERRGRSLESL
jgi:hypothetical protein